MRRQLKFMTVSMFALMLTMFFIVGGYGALAYAETKAETPAAPRISTVTDTKVVVWSTKGNQYSMDGVNWQYAVTFENLKPETEYTFYQRVAKSGSVAASDASPGTTVRTKTPAAPATTPIIEETGVSHIKVKYIKGMEYSLNGETWQDSNEFLSAEPLTTYTVYQRIKGTDLKMTGEIGTTGTTTLRAKSVPEGYTGIYNVDDLDAIRKNPDGKYILMRDIVFDEADFKEGGKFYNNGKGWEPIGDPETQRFQGIFNGNGYTVRGMRLYGQMDGKWSYGLFGSNLGTIRNLGILDQKILIIDNITMSTTTALRAGSIAGYSSGVISDCYNYGSVEFSSNVRGSEIGGLVGANGGTLKNCYNHGAVRGVTLKSCWVSVGGICGRGAATNCYNTGMVFAYAEDNSYVERGGICGIGNGMTSYCVDYVLRDKSFQTYFNDQTNYVSEEKLRRSQTFVDFDFKDTWTFDGEYPYPQLQKVNNVEPCSNTDEFAYGSGTVFSPYVIENISHLDHVRQHLGSYYVMCADLDFSDMTEAWSPIGQSAMDGFFGDFEGNGYIVENLNMTKVLEENYTAGIFGYSDGAIRNLGVESGIYDFTIPNHALGTKNETYVVGGITGYNSGLISSCYNTNDISVIAGNITGFTAVFEVDAGGLVGNGKNGIIRNAFNNGMIHTETAQGGGLNTGGIVGQSGKVEYCYNLGDVTQDDMSTSGPGGISGGMMPSIQNCYSVKPSGGKNPHESNVIYLTLEELQDETVYEDFNFEDIWFMDADPLAEYPYPLLRVFYELEDEEPILLEDCKLKVEDVLYTGAAVKPDVHVYYMGIELEEDIDYVVEDVELLKYGIGRVILRGIDCFEGTLVRNFGVQLPDLEAPSKVTADLYGHDDVEIRWDEVDYADGYQVYYKKSTSSAYTYHGMTSDLTYSIENLSDGVKYAFRVYPYIEMQDEIYPDSSYKSASVYTLSKIGTPVVEKYTSKKVNITWKNIPGETGYQISKSTKSTGTNIVDTYQTTSGKSRVLSVTKGKTYYYKVRAYKEVDGVTVYGPWSSVRTYKL